MRFSGEVCLCGDDGCFRPAARAELAEDVAQVKFDGDFREVEFAADFLVREAARDELRER